MTQQHIGTQCVQAGYRPENGEPRQIPIYQSTTYRYDSGDSLAKLFSLDASGYFYTRLANPTNDLVAAKITALEGGTAGMLTSSGQAAIFYSVFNLVGSGDHVVVSSAIYGGAYNLFNTTMRRMGVDFTFVSVDATEEELDAAFKPNTKAVYGETISNPSTAVLDLELWAKVAHKHGVPLIVDNTFATPINCRPFEWGADIVVHSTSKYMDGHACAIGGAIVDSGKFIWDKHKEKFPGLTAPDPSYHGIVYTEKFGQAAYIVKATAQLMRDFGSIPSPQNSFLLGLGLESLHLRQKRHSENGLQVALWLANRDKATWVDFCELESSPYYARAKKYLPNGSCGVVSFGVKGGYEGARKFMDSLKLVSIVTHVADARSSILHPASTTHSQLTDEELLAAGVKPDMLRLSVGIEDVEDVIADLDQAFNSL